MKHTVLIVDDFNISNEIVSDHLKKMGFETISCLRALKALEILKIKQIDIVITDLTMPEMDGLELLTELRNISGHESTPVLFLSATNDPEIITAAENLGIEAWLKKPVNLEELDRILMNIITGK